MNLMRKVLLVLITPLFSLLLFATALDFGIIRTAGHPASVKKIIADSGVYKNIIPGALDQAKTSTSGSGGVSLTDPIVKDAATKTLSPQYVQTQTEGAIDSVYRWLDGKTPVPDFRIDLSQQKATFAGLIGQAAATRAASLPTCTSLATPLSFDAFASTCLPAGLTAAQAGAAAQNDILNGKGFLDKTTLTAADAKSSGSNQSVFTDKLKNVPKAYQNAKKTPWALVLLSLLTAAGIVFLSASRRRGVRRVGITLAAVGIFMLIFAWGLNYGVTKKALPKLKNDNAVFQSDIKALVTDLEQAIDKNYWQFGTVYAVLGTIAIAGPMIWDKRQAPKKRGAVHAAHSGPGLDSTPNQQLPEEPDVQTEQPPAPKKSTKKQVKIQ